jgi:flagellar hook-associated protein 3 FlgL
MNEIESLGSLNDDVNLQYQQTLSQLQDLDYAKSYSDLTRMQVDLEAAQKSFTRISQLSLFNYL